MQQSSPGRPLPQIPFKWRENHTLKSRIITAGVLIPFVLALIFSPGVWGVAILATTVLILSSKELFMLLGCDPKSTTLISFFWITEFMLSALLLFTTNLNSVYVFIIILYSILNISLVRLSTAWKTVDFCSAFLVLSLPLILLSKLALVESNELNFRWHTHLLIILLPIWAGDSAAYFIGRKFGKRKLAPNISPNKTVEGSIANLLAAMMTGLILAGWVQVPLWLGGAVGVLAGILGQIGDLGESYLKRKAGVKDSGNLLPGHGGILDRVDSLLFAAAGTVPILLIWLKSKS